MQKLLFTLFCCVIFLSAYAQEPRRIGMAYYNVDKLYDTIPSTFYDDKDFTPRGKYRWSGERYYRKVENIARVLDSMRIPIVMLYGMENENVVRDIVERCEEDYAYIHRTQDYSDGLDFALLYYGDIFFPEKVTPWHKALCVEGVIEGQQVAIIGNNRSTSIGVLINELGLMDGDNKIVLLGAPNKLNFDKYGLSDHLDAASRSGYGNRVRSNRWEMYDRIASNISATSSCGVYIKSWLLSEGSYPNPTFERGIYRGGGSSLLPVFIYFDKIFAH